MFEPMDYQSEKALIKAQLKKITKRFVPEFFDYTFKPWFRIDRFFRRCAVCGGMAWRQSSLLKIRWGYGSECIAFHLGCLLIPAENLPYPDKRDFILKRLDELYSAAVAEEAQRSQVYSLKREVKKERRKFKL